MMEFSTTLDVGARQRALSLYQKLAKDVSVKKMQVFVVHVLDIMKNG